MEQEKLYNFLEGYRSAEEIFIEDLKKVEYHVQELIENIYARGQNEEYKKDIKEIEKFFSYWRQHSKGLKIKTK